MFKLKEFYQYKRNLVKRNKVFKPNISFKKSNKLPNFFQNFSFLFRFFQKNVFRKKSIKIQNKTEMRIRFLEKRVQELVDTNRQGLVEFCDQISRRCEEFLNACVEKAFKAISAKFDTLLSSVESKLSKKVVAQDNPKLIEKLNSIAEFTKDLAVKLHSAFGVNDFRDYSD